MNKGCRSYRNRVLVVTPARPRGAKGDAKVVRTPLDMIAALETEHDRITTVVLAGSFANDEVASFLSEAYPSLAIIANTPDEEPDTYLPVYA